MSNIETVFVFFSLTYFEKWLVLTLYKLYNELQWFKWHMTYGMSFNPYPNLNLVLILNPGLDV